MAYSLRETKKDSITLAKRNYSANCGKAMLLRQIFLLELEIERLPNCFHDWQRLQVTER